MSNKDSKDTKALPSKSKDSNLPTTKTEPLTKQEGETSKKDAPSSKDSHASAKNTEKYDQLRKKLVQQILKKQELSKKLTTLEDSIYQKEMEYFEDSPLGNIIKGFENITKTSGGGSSANKRRVVYTEDDHIFSLSSVNYIKQMLKRQGQSINGSSKDDFDDYEDSVDPTTANLGAKAASIERSETPSSGSTPSRKRKARTFDD
ncbi:Chromatin modification-related protein EAF6 [Candida viswanathii]|uniref:Chromatin modification-related protein EAF6 n=1 Tax=Candida viswanathii TaxID=5486 RepID=A0A367YK99_9ASCO|nr:Chromatin modification-related protein EAF6 [Candida viswanathii]